jgi:guanylate kinase
VRPATWEELERRLRGRLTEPEEAVRRRLDEARRELTLADRYRHQVTNDDLDRAVEELDCILLSEARGTQT